MPLEPGTELTDIELSAPRTELTDIELSDAPSLPRGLTSMELFGGVAPREDVSMLEGRERAMELPSFESVSMLEGWLLTIAKER